VVLGAAQPRARIGPPILECAAVVLSVDHPYLSTLKMRPRSHEKMIKIDGGKPMLAHCHWQGKRQLGVTPDDELYELVAE
jgi:hypothetical protein